MVRWLHLARIALFIAACLYVPSLAAQVNVEPLRAKLKDGGATYHFRGALSMHQGNTNASAASAGALTGWSTGPYLGYLNATVDYAESNYEANVTKVFAHARFDRRLVRALHGEVFVQFEHDPFRELDTRELFGSGPRLEFDWEQWRLHGGMSYMLELTKRRVGAAAGEYVARHRLNNYATVNYTPHPNVELSETVYFQPRFDRVSDYFLLSIFGAKFSVTSTLSTGIDLIYRRENVVPAGVEQDDVQMMNSISLTF